MTLILGAFYRSGMFQASDRLTTLRADASEWDLDANKSLIVRLDDEVVFLGYSGNAYIDDLPTDSWLAAAIAAVRIVGPTQLQQPLPKLARLPLTGIVDRIAAALQLRVGTMSGRERAQFFLTAQVLAMVRPRRTSRPRARAFEITASPAADGVKVRRPAVPDEWWARSPQRQQRPYLQMTPPNRQLSSKVLGALQQPSSLRDPQTFLETMTRCIHAVARDASSVGADVLTMAHFPTWAPTVYVAFTRRGAVRHTLGGHGLSEPASYTPWYLSPNGYFAPRLSTPLEMQLAGDPISIEVVGDTRPGPPFFMGSQTQPRPPSPK